MCAFLQILIPNFFPILVQFKVLNLSHKLEQSNHEKAPIVGAFLLRKS